MIQEILITILYILGIATGTAIIMSQGWYDYMIDEFRMNYKPFSCTMCMSFWITLIVLLISGTGFIIALSVAFINGYVAEMLYRKINYM